MTVTVEIIRGSTTYDMSSGNPFWVMSLTGIGLPPVRLLKERGPQQHGSTVVGYLLDERLLNMAMLIKAPSEAVADTYRDDLAEILKPVEGVPVQIRLTHASAKVRQIDSYTVNMVDFPMTNQDRFAGAQTVIAQFEAPDPIPYDPTLRNIIFDTSGGSGYQIPLEVPFAYTTGTAINQVVSLAYTGKREVYPRIYITGPAEDLKITNETIGKVLDFTGHVIAGGDTYEIDLRYGYKVITDQNGTRQNSALTDDSNLADWRIEATPLAPGGINDIRVEVADQATAATQIRVEFYDKHPSMG